MGTGARRAALSSLELSESLADSRGPRRDQHAPRLTRTTRCCTIGHTCESVSSPGSNPDMAIEHSMSTSYPVSACADGSQGVTREACSGFGSDWSGLLLTPPRVASNLQPPVTRFPLHSLSLTGIAMAVLARELCRATLRVSMSV